MRLCSNIEKCAPHQTSAPLHLCIAGCEFNMDHFPLFPNLPTEIRLQIWRYSMPDDDEPEVCLLWPSNVPGYHAASALAEHEPLYELPCQPLTVDVAFPVGMHVCREARSVMQDSRRSGVRFRASEAAGCPTPFRWFRPDFDVLYLGHDAIWLMEWVAAPGSTALEAAEPETEAGKLYSQLMATLSRTRQFAVPASLETRFRRIIARFLSFLFQQADDPEQLSFELCLVVPATHGLAERDLMSVHAAFAQPGRRCRLAFIDRDRWNAILVPRDQNVRRPPPQRLDTLANVVAETEASLPASWLHRALNDGLGTALLDAVTVAAATFEEYQPDGTWCETCADRMYHSWYTELSGPEIPLHERPDPEVVRVNDADIEFRPKAHARPRAWEIGQF